MIAHYRPELGFKKEKGGGGTGTIHYQLTSSFSGTSTECGYEKRPVGRKHGALRPQKHLRLIRDGEVGGSGISNLTVTPTYTVTSRMILH